MNLDELLDQLAELPREVYGYLLLAALAGPALLRLFGFKALAGLVRPLALVVLLGGMVAKQSARR
jgi:hypothetical protein